MTKKQRNNLIRILFQHGWQDAAISFRIWNEGGHQQEIHEIIYADCKESGDCDLGQKDHKECDRKFMANRERYDERLHKFCEGIDPEAIPEYPPWIDGQDILGIEIERRRKIAPDIPLTASAPAAVLVSISHAVRRAR